MWYILTEIGKPIVGHRPTPKEGYIEVTDEVMADLNSKPANYIWDGTTLVEPPQPPPYVPTQEEIIAALESSLDTHLDSVARTHRYNDRFTCALRAGYPGPYHDEGVTFATWMDTCNSLAYQIMVDCLAGTRAIPTAEELIAELPTIVW